MTVRIRDIFESLSAFSQETTVSAALQYFRSMPDLQAVPVVYDAVPLGLLHRNIVIEAGLRPELMHSILQQPVTRLMSPDFDMVEFNEPAAYVAKRLIEGGTKRLRSGVIVVEGGCYAGYVRFEQLFAAVTNENTARAVVMKKREAKIKNLHAEYENMREEQVNFISFLAHEIRTPLTGVLGVADLLADRKLEPEAREYARTISQSGEHLDSLLSDVLDLTRLEVGKLDITPQPFKLSDFVQETRALWSAKADKKNITLRVNADDRDIGRIEADPTRLRQILFNLIGNAMKFTDSGSVSVDLSVISKGRGNEVLEMKVADTGIGISDADKQRMFEAFEQASAQTVHQFGGTGLGLSIARGLIERMGGSISLADNPGGGAVFTVSCPIRKAGPRLAIENTPRRRSANFQLGRILLVEDHEVSRTVIAESLRAVGWTVDIVETAMQGQRRGLEIPYQAILLDLHLDTASGMDVIETLRSEEGPNKSRPIIAVSADVSEARIAVCELAGFDGFIAKPIRPRHLVATLVDMIIEREALEKAEAAPLIQDAGVAS